MRILCGVEYVQHTKQKTNEKKQKNSGVKQLYTRETNEKKTKQFLILIFIDRRRTQAE